MSNRRRLTAIMPAAFVLPLVLFTSSFSNTAAAGDWLHFRGTDTTGATAESNLPDEIDPKKAAWSVELPGSGAASPIVVGDKVFVSASSGPTQERLHVIAYEVASGRQLWHRQLWATGSPLTHPMSGNAAPSPASDGQRVVALYSSNDLVCFDLAGRVQWVRGLTYDEPRLRNDVGLASSPIIVGGVCVVQIETQGAAFVAGIDLSTGQTRWSIDRTRGANWASPAVLRGKAGAPDAVLAQSPDQLTALDPTTGRVLWNHVAGCAGIASSMAIGGQVLVPAAGTTALLPGGEGQLPQVLWKNSTLQSTSTSTVADGERLFVLNRSGVLNAADLKTAKVLWKLRLGGTFWSTPVLAGGRLYAINQDGAAYVVDISGKRGRLLHTGQLAETIVATPAIADGALYVRSDKRLWKFAAK